MVFLKANGKKPMRSKTHRIYVGKMYADTWRKTDRLKKAEAGT